MSRPVLIVDLEATCWSDREQSAETMEVIELAGALVDGDGAIQRSFSTFVRPVDNPVLSSFCTELTSIRQEDVDGAPGFPEACRLVNEWLGSTRGLVWGSWGGYDRNQLLAEQRRHGLAPAFLDVPHVNLKKAWKKSQKCKPMGLRGALRYHDLVFEGTPHRGIDDCKNIARLMPFISKDMVNAAVDEWMRRAS